MTRQVMLTAVLFIALACNRTEKNSSNEKDILTADIDSTVNPADDFFEYANGDWIKKNPIPPEESAWGIGNLVVEENLNRLRQINEQAAKTGGPKGSTQQKIGDFWTAAMDTTAIEKHGLQPLKPYLSKIDGISGLNNLQATMAELDVIGVQGLIGFYIGQDAKNSNVNALQLWQAGIGLPEREFYFKTDSTSKAIRLAYVNHIARILEMTGEDSDRARSAAKDIMSVETELARSHRRLEDLRDPYANYNKMAVADLRKLAPSIDWNDYMTIYGVSQVDSVIVGQPEYYKEAGATLKTIPLETWKNYLKFRLVENFSVALPDTFGKEDFAFNKLLSGAEERRPRWKRVLRSEEDVMGELLGQLYVKEFFDSTTKKRYEKIVEAIRNALKNRIQNLTWMSDSTKQKALLKLAAVKKKVGYPDKWKNFSAMQIGTESYVQNLINASLWWHGYAINKLGKPVNKDEWDMYPQTYNAYYNPSNNEIVLPAGIFTVPGFKDKDLDDALVYGYAGASTIGHELTHGFDDEGRQYDANGNLTNWWTQEDSAKFSSRADMLAKQFSNYVVVDTFKINGKATLGENIADLGGILLGWDAFSQTDEFRQNKKIHGLEPAERYFLGYALGWLGHEREEALRTQVLTDVHSPAKFRVNGPFSDVDAFYSVFNVKPGNKMYLPDSSRVHIW